MDKGVWWATAMGSQRVKHDWLNKHVASLCTLSLEVYFRDSSWGLQPVIKMRQFSEPPLIFLYCTDLLHISPNNSSGTIPMGFSFWRKIPKKETSGRKCSSLCCSFWCSSLNFTIHLKCPSGWPINQVCLGGLLSSEWHKPPSQKVPHAPQSRAPTWVHPMLHCKVLPYHGKGLPGGVQEGLLRPQVFRRPQELMLSNCGAGEHSWESLGQQGDPTSQS